MKLDEDENAGVKTNPEREEESERTNDDGGGTLKTSRGEETSTSSRVGIRPMAA